MKELEKLLNGKQFDLSLQNLKFYRAKIVQSGEYREIELYPMYKRSYAKGQRKNVTGLYQGLVNKNNSTKKLIRLMNTNFKEGDLWLDFTYDYKPTVEEAKKEIRSYIRRVRRRFGDIKYIYTTEIGKRATGRGHHHFICDLPIEHRTELEDMWKKGVRIRSRRLYKGEHGFTKAATYLSKKSEDIYRTYTTSKNLTKPKIKIRDGLIGKRAIDDLTRNYEIAFEKIQKTKALRDYKITSLEIENSDFVAGSYVYIKMRRKE